MAKGSLENGPQTMTDSIVNRARSNTWSVGHQRITTGDHSSGERVDDHDGGGVVLTTLNCSSVEADSSGSGASVVTNNVFKDSVTNFRKNWTRRNAWGNLSYAELITKAIESSPEKRLTLSQIYEWIVQNVEYFANKGDNSSSAGWKNSIRHNLSLHSRFVRLVNDGAGKSSWWSINPDAQPLKPSRRRAATLDSKTMTKKMETGIGQQKLDFAGRSLEEVDSTTSGHPVFCPSSLLRNPEEAMEAVLKISPSHRYPGKNGFSKRVGHTNDQRHLEGKVVNGSPPYGLGFMTTNAIDVFKAEGHDPERPFSENLSSPGNSPGHGNGREEGTILGKRRFPHAEDRTISLGFCAGNGIYYDEGFEAHPCAPANNYYQLDQKRYFDETGYAAYGGGRHDNGYFPHVTRDAGYGYYNNGGSYNGRAHQEDGCAGESEGSRKMAKTGTGGCNGSYIEPREGDPSRPASGSKMVGQGEENRKVMPFSGSRYCGTYQYDSAKRGAYSDSARSYQGLTDPTLSYHRDEEIRSPAVSKFHGETKSENGLGSSLSFFNALTTTSSYSSDFPTNTESLRPMSSASLPLVESYYRPSGDKYLCPPSSSPKSFSQLLANRITFPTCRNGNANDDYYIPTTF